MTVILSVKSSKYHSLAVVGGCLLSFLAAPVFAQQSKDGAVTQDKSVQVAAAAQTDGASGSKVTDDASLKLALAKVSLDQETGKLDEAFTLIDELKAQYPDNSQVLAAEAELNFNIGNRGAAFAELNKAKLMDPGNEDILDRERAANLAQGPFSSAGYTYRGTTEADEQFEHFTSLLNVTPTITASVNLENDYMSTKTPITRVNGTTQGFWGNRQRGTVSFDKIFDNGTEGVGSLYAANEIVGAGGLYRWWDHSGATSVEGNFNRPNWDYVETVIEHGVKDNLRLERKQVFTPNIQGTLGAGYNRYGLRHDDDAAESAAWNLDLGYTYQPYSSAGTHASGWTLGANYTVDSEYFTHTDQRINNTGVSFKPLPTQDYEIHAVNLSAGKEIVPELYVNGNGGYAVNRLTGNSGPLYGVMATYSPIEKLGFEFHASRTRLGGENNSGREDIIGANVKWLW